MSIPLSVKGVTKTYQDFKAVDNVSLDLQQGQILGLLGPNGCGKSTLFKMVLGLAQPTEGQISVLGSTVPDEYKQRMSVMLDESSFDPSRSGAENIQTVAIIKGCTKADYMPWVQMLEMEPFLRRKVGKYSYGMKKRLALAAALMKPAELYLLDEPGNGLDIPGIVQVRSILQKLREEGRTVILSSHLLGDVERTCTHVALMHRGKLLEQGTTQDVVGGYNSLEDSFMAKLNFTQQQ